MVGKKWEREREEFRTQSNSRWGRGLGRGGGRENWRGRLYLAAISACPTIDAGAKAVSSQATAAGAFLTVAYTRAG